MKMTNEEVELTVDSMFRGLHIDPSKLSDGMYWKMRIKLLKKVDEGLRQLHISPGTDFWDYNMDERAECAIKYVLDRDTSNDVKISVEEFDRQTLAPYVPAEMWATMTKDHKNMHIGKMPISEWIVEIEKHGHNYYGA
jgi:hypothetical protein